MLESLEGRVGIVTGAGRGIGRAAALAFAARGASVVVNDASLSLDGTSRESDSAAAVVAEIEASGGSAAASADSVADWESAQQIVALALDRFGRLDLLVNNAGLSDTAPIHDLDPEVFDRIVRSHLHGTFHCTRAALPHMRGRGSGRIVNLVSRAGLLGMPGSAAYGAAKGGVFGLTNAASRDLAGTDIAINAVSPAATETRMVTTAIDAMSRQDEAAKSRARGLRAALQPPEAVAALIVALCTERTSRFNGEVFYIENGRLGIFRPLEVEPSIECAGAWTDEAVADALERLEGHSSAEIYKG